MCSLTIIMCVSRLRSLHPHSNLLPLPLSQGGKALEPYVPPPAAAAAPKKDDKAKTAVVLTDAEVCVSFC